MKNRRVEASPSLEQVHEWRSALARKIAVHIGSAEDLATAIPGLTLYQRTAPTTPCSAAYEPSVAILAQGQKRIDLGKTTFVYEPSRYLLTAVDLPTVSRVVEASEEAPCLAMGLKLDMAVIREILSRDEFQVTEVPSDTPAMATGEVTVELLSACCRLMDLLKTPEDIPFLSAVIQREIVYRLLRGEAAARLRAIATTGDQSQRTAKAITWLKANYTKPLRVEELAEMARMGVSTFHHHFREMTAMSPVQYQKLLRLHAARGLMLMDGLDASSAAIEVGYESVSQFNREYGRFFGQPPMRDIKALRLANAAAESRVQ